MFYNQVVESCEYITWFMKEVSDTGIILVNAYVYGYEES